MEIVGKIVCSVSVYYDETVINKELLIKANIMENIKKKFDFSVMRVPPPEKISGESVQFEGGKYNYNSQQILLNELTIGSRGINISVVDKTPIAKAAILEVIELIENSGLCPQLSQVSKTWGFKTSFEAKLEFSNLKLLNPEYIEFALSFSRKLEKENYDIELHPYEVGISFVYKPNIQKLARKSLGPNELAKIFKAADFKSVTIYHQGLDDFYKGIVNVDTHLDYEETVTFIEELERRMGH